MEGGGVIQGTDHLSSEALAFSLIVRRGHLIIIMIMIIVIMEICKRPTYQNILTAQGAYTSKNNDNMLQHKIEI